ncbi:MAG: YIP1 family protein [Haloarculaceae archaeon]
MPSTMASLVTDPDSFFWDRSDAPSFIGPVLIVTGIAILGVVSSVVSLRATSEMMSQVMADAGAGQGAQTLLQAFQLVGVVIGFVVTYVVWVLWTGIFYGITAVFDGSGSFTLWAGLLWTFAVKHARQVTTRNAAIAVAFPVLFGLAASLWGLVTAVNVL